MIEDVRKGNTIANMMDGPNSKEATGETRIYGIQSGG